MEEQLELSIEIIAEDGSNYEIPFTPEALSSLSSQQYDTALEEIYLGLSDENWTEKYSSKKGVSLKMGKHKDREGGLTKEGIAKYNRETGSNLKVGVTWKPKTQEDFRRKGSFLTRFYTNPSGPLVKPSGEPSRLALASKRWNEPVPTTQAAAARLAAKGRTLLAKAETMKEKKTKVERNSIDIYQEFSIPSSNPSDYLVVEDKDKTSTYRLQVKENGKVNPNLMGAAWRALFHPSGHMGNPYKGPDKEQAKTKLAAIYKSAGKEMPTLEKHSLEDALNTTEEYGVGMMRHMYYDAYNMLSDQPNLEASDNQKVNQWASTLIESFWTQHPNLEDNMKSLGERLVENVVLYGQFTKEQCHYATKSSDIPSHISHRCKDCVFYADDASTCYIVEGDVEPEGWCRFYIATETPTITLSSTPLLAAGYTTALEEKEQYTSIPDNFIQYEAKDRDVLGGKFSFSEYAQAIKFSTELQEFCNSYGHHPILMMTRYTAPGADVYLEFSTNDEEIDGVTIELHTVTQKDIHVASKANELYSSVVNLSIGDVDLEIDYEAQYFIDQLNLALSIGEEDDLEQYSENIFVDKAKHSKAKSEARQKFQVYPSVYANLWMVRRYKAMGGTFRNKS